MSPPGTTRSPLSQRASSSSLLLSAGTSRRCASVRGSRRPLARASTASSAARRLHDARGRLGGELGARGAHGRVCPHALARSCASGARRRRLISPHARAMWRVLVIRAGGAAPRSRRHSTPSALRDATPRRCGSSDLHPSSADSCCNCVGIGRDARRSLTPGQLRTHLGDTISCTRVLEVVAQRERSESTRHHVERPKVRKQLPTTHQLA